MQQQVVTDCEGKEIVRTKVADPGIITPVPGNETGKETATSSPMQAAHVLCLAQETAQETSGTRKWEAQSRQLVIVTLIPMTSSIA